MLMTENIKMTFICSTPESSHWCCQKCGTVIGRVIIHNHNEYLDMVSERGIKLLGSADVHCIHCGSVREWHPGQEAINHLVKRVVDSRKR